MRRILFLFWILVTVVTVLQLARYPGDAEWWITTALVRVFPIPDLARLKRALELT